MTGLNNYSKGEGTYLKERKDDLGSDSGLTKLDIPDPDEEEEEEEKEKEKQRVGVFELFRYADHWDVLMIVVATISAVGNGAAWPLTTVVFSDAIETFVNFGKYENFLNKIPDQLSLLNITKREALNDISLLLPYCPQLKLLTKNKVNCSLLPTMDDIFQEMVDRSMIFIYGGAVVIVLATLQMHFWMVTSERQSMRMRQAFYRNIMRQEMAWFDGHNAGELVVRLADDISKIQEAIGDKGGALVQWTTGFGVGVGVCLGFGWELALVMQSTAPMLFLAAASVAFFFSTMTRKERSAYAKAGGVAEEVFSLVRTVQAFGGQEKEAVRYNANLNDASKFGIQKSLVSGLGQGLIWFLVFSTWGLGFWYGGRLVRHGEYSIRDMLTVFFTSLIGCLSLGFAAPALMAINTGRGAAYDVFQIIDKKSAINSAAVEGLRPLALKGNIRIKSVHFNYPTRPSVKVLKGLDLTVQPGQTVALVGASGCGKSTIIQLLLRFYDVDSGQICLDGVNIQDLNIKWLRQNIGLVGQEPVLFPTTIAENIRYGRDGVTDEEIILACKDANAYDFVMNMPDKLETYVGERGTQLSGGQKQRIAIARALVKNPSVLLLDEATSALDHESEAVVQDALDKASKGRTTIVVAHRLSTIRFADVIVVLDQGQVVERGTHDELMVAGGHYFQLVSSQLRKLGYETSSGNESEGGLKRHLRKDSGRPDLLSREDLTMITKQDEADTEEEDSNGLISGRGVVVRTLWLNLPEWHFMALGCLSSFINGATQPAWALIQAYVMEAFAKDDLSEQKDIMEIMALYSVGLGLVSLVAYFLQEYMFGISGEALTLRMRNILFRAMLRQNIGWFDDKKHETGALNSQLAVEASAVQGVAKTALGSLLLSLGNLGTGFAISFIYSWQLSLVVGAFVPPTVIAGMFTVALYAGTATDGKTSMEEICKEAMVSIDNIRTVASLTKEEKFYDNFSKSLAIPFKRNLKKSALGCITYGFTHGVHYMSFGVGFYYSSKLLEYGDVKFDDVFKVLGCLLIGGMQMGRSMAFAPDMNVARKAARRIFALHDKVPSIDASSETGLKPIEGTFKSNIRFADVKFRYPTRPDVTILNGLDLSVEKGQTLALTGESGCGKSTTCQLIERFYDPEHGNIFLDAHNIKDLNLQWLRSQIGLVSQEPVLFDRSVAENIAYGDNSRDVSMEEIIRAARSANIHNFIQSLPSGYDTNVGTKGTQLSGGQKQRIAIARALIRNPKILLLDEATSALDTESEAIVQEALDKARRGRTCITIAHRLSTIQDADKIVVFKDGVVHEAGTHNQLVARGGLYFNLLNTSTQK